MCIRDRGFTNPKLLRKVSASLLHIIVRHGHVIPKPSVAPKGANKYGLFAPSDFTLEVILNNGWTNMDIKTEQK